MLEKDYIKATTQLNAIAKLEDNWNNNGAKPFSTKLINKCRKILMQLVRAFHITYCVWFNSIRIRERKW